MTGISVSGQTVGINIKPGGGGNDNRTFPMGYNAYKFGLQEINLTALLSQILLTSFLSSDSGVVGQCMGLWGQFGMVLKFLMLMQTQ